MKVETLDRLEAVGAAAWRDLHAASHLRSPFLSFTWQREWARAFASTRRVEVRTVKDDTTIGTTQVVEGDRIVMGIASANRDESCYERSEEFRLDRAGEPEHLAFGAGPHQCAGMNLARMEGRIAISRFLARFPNYCLAGKPVRNRRARFRGFASLPLELC